MTSQNEKKERIPGTKIQKVSRSERRRRNQDRMKDLTKNYHDMFPDQNQVERVFISQAQKRKPFGYLKQVMGEDPNVNPRYIQSYETQLGKKVVNALVSKIIETYGQAMKDAGIDRIQLTSMVSAAYAADDWKSTLFSVAQKALPYAMEYVPKIINTVQKYFKIPPSSPEPSLTGQIMHSAINYAERPSEQRSQGIQNFDLQLALKSALCAALNPANYKAQVPRPSGEVVYSIGNNFRTRIPITTNSTGTAAVSVLPWALNSASYAILFNQDLMNINTGNNNSLAGILTAGPLSSISGWSSWNVVSTSVHWEPTASALNQQGTTYLALVPDFNNINITTTFAGLPTLQNIIPDVSGPSVAARDILYIGDSTEQFTNTPFYGSSSGLVELISFIITGATNSQIVGNLVIDVAYELKLSNVAFPLIRPSPMPPSNEFANLMSKLEWANASQTLNVRTQEAADRYCLRILSHDFDMTDLAFA